ncbi:MAG: AbrB/MazE/SpoVT family DNA-binding domain-containing protein [Spirochaetales bacterium]|nr:AbrB/MazE/SpoVT family DNA-binding domain-containing protein [Spirochaetales bacterium]
MLVSIIPIGNSKGIRIPKSILDQLDAEDKLEMEIQNGELLLKPIKKTPRQGWKEAFTRMHENNEDMLISDDIEDSSEFDWDW